MESDLNGLGVDVSYGQGKDSKAIKHNQLCLEIIEKVNGKGSIETVSTLNKIGNAYSEEGNYSKAI